MKVSDFRIPTAAALGSPQARFRMLHRPYRILQRFVFPPQCLACDRFFHIPHHDTAAGAENAGSETGPVPVSWQGHLDKLLAACLCPACIRGLVAVESPVCDCCGLPLSGRPGAEHRCGDCIAQPKNFRIARAPLIYEQILTRVIQRFKYKGKIQLADPLAELLLRAFRSLWEKDSIDMILPVPLHIKRFRKRGFNQSYLLVRNWNMLAGQHLRGPARLAIERNLLLRTVATAPQIALGRAKRAVNIQNAFDLSDRDKVNEKRILLVDDVYTTGATVNECARVLMASGARHVDVLTLARAI